MVIVNKIQHNSETMPTYVMFKYSTYLMEYIIDCFVLRIRMMQLIVMNFAEIKKN